MQEEFINHRINHRTTFFQRGRSSPEEVIVGEGVPGGCVVVGERHSHLHQHLQQPLLAQRQSQLRRQLLHPLRRAKLHDWGRDCCWRGWSLCKRRAHSPSSQNSGGHRQFCARRDSQQRFAESASSTHYAPTYFWLRPHACAGPHALIRREPGGAGAHGCRARHGSRSEPGRFSRLTPTRDGQTEFLRFFIQIMPSPFFVFTELLILLCEFFSTLVNLQ